MIYICKPRKVALYINTGKKTAAEIKAETGCDAILNGGLYNMSTFKPVCHLKADGKVLSTDQYQYWGYGWSGDEFPKLMTDYSGVDNYIHRTCLVRNGKKEPFHSGDPGPNAFSAIGTFADGRLWIYCDHTSRDRVEIQQIAIDAGVQDAVLLDGGGSTQLICPDGKLTTSRRNHNYILIWLAKEETEPTKESEQTVFKLALGAGHYMGAPGKRCHKSLDPNETREWWLSDRVGDYVEAGLARYNGIEVLRLDDSDDGAENVALADRVAAANRFGADLYISLHHNAAGFVFTGGGIMAFTHPSDKGEAVEWRDALYDALIAETGLKGNRSTPKTTGNYQVLRDTKMPAVLLELGFMDSKADVPVILSDAFARGCARAIVNTIAARANLTPKSVSPTSWERAVMLGHFAEQDKGEPVTSEILAALLDKLGLLE